MIYKGTLKIDLKRLAAEKNVSLWKLAQLAGVNYRTVWMLANGRTSKVYLSTLESVAAALGVEVADLFTDTLTRQRGPLM